MSLPPFRPSLTPCPGADKLAAFHFAAQMTDDRALIRGARQIRAGDHGALHAIPGQRAGTGGVTFVVALAFPGRQFVRARRGIPDTRFAIIRELITSPAPGEVEVYAPRALQQDQTNDKN